MGFSLLELLVALSLVTVVLLIAGLQLASVRGFSRHVQTAGNEVPEWLELLRDDLLHMSRFPLGEDQPVFALDPVDGLRWQRQPPLQDAGAASFSVKYVMSPAEAVLLRAVRREGLEQRWQTNVVGRALRSWQVEVLLEDRMLGRWPESDRPEARAEVPLRLRVTWLTGGQADAQTRELLLPAGLRVAAP